MHRVRVYECITMYYLVSMVGELGAVLNLWVVGSCASRKFHSKMNTSVWSCAENDQMKAQSPSRATHLLWQAVFFSKLVLIHSAHILWFVCENVSRAFNFSSPSPLHPPSLLPKLCVKSTEASVRFYLDYTRSALIHGGFLFHVEM